MKKTFILILFALLAFGQMAWAQWTGTGIETDPYQISSTADLNTLATNVNNGNDYSGKFFKLMNNIAYVYTGIPNENNYTAIGVLSHSFNGHFDGNNKTVSGVRIYNDSDYQGLFGHINGEVKNLTLDDAIIAGGSRTGGIAGQNNGNVTNCRVTASVSVVSGNDFIGGVVGFNYSTVSQCTSSVTLTKNANNCDSYGAIVGINGSYGTLSDNLAIGATVPAASGNYHGAIVGMNDSGTLERNYYRNCTVAGVVNALRVGCAGADVTDNNGALSLHTLSLGNGITASTPTINYNGVGYYARTNSVTLACTIPAPVGYHYVYLVDGEAVSGDTFAMPDTDATITTTTAYTLDYEHITSTDSREFYRFNYPSTSVTGEPVLLSAALVFWKSSSMQDSIQAVHLCCHHTFTANSECPSLSIQGVSIVEANSFMASVMTGGGGGLYSSVVIMPDYEGFGVSSDRTHPYLAEEVTAHQTVDAMTFGLQVYQHLVDEGSALALSHTWRSFTLGYSQGGSVALATHRYIEQHNLYNELHFRGSLCGDGPYDLITTLQYYLFDNGTSYEVTTDHRQGQCTLPVVIPMIMRGMMLSDPYAGSHSLSDYLSQQFLDTGILDWLDSKTMSTDDIAGAWKQQLTNGFTAANGTTYTHEQMAEMFIDKSTSTSSTVWAKLSKVFTPGFYAYLTDASNFNSVPTATGDPYQDMHRALANNSLCTGWNPNHRIQFKHSKGDMVVPYGNYFAYKDAHDGEGTRYRVDNSFSTDDHQAAGFSFFLGLRNWNGDFQWLDGSPLEWSGSGTEADPYVINNTDEWQLLVDSVSAGNNYSGKFFRLGDDISVTTMVGTSGFTFNGTFDGNGHTLNVTFSGSGTDNTAGTAPFKYISGATIKNLHVTGSISTTGMRPASIASFVVENSTIINCWSEVAISSSYNKDIDAGGFVSRVNQNKSVTLTGCVFTGSITYSNETGYEGGGMVGYTQSGATATLNNCLFAPSAISITKYNTTGDDWKKHWMFVGGRVRGTYTNCYYNDVAATEAEGGMVAENIRMYSIGGGSNVTVANAGSATEYNVSGITSYGVGIKYGDVLYAGNGDNVSLNLSVPEGYVVSGNYFASAGTLTGTSNPYTLTMPSQNVTITADVTLVALSREIEGYGNGNDRWVFIASPISGSIAPTQVGNIFSATEYDLYRFNQSPALIDDAYLEWENYHKHNTTENPFMLVNGQGYLYATKETQTLVFTGTFNEATEQEVLLIYHDTNPDANMHGWNLVGNPFITTATLSQPYYRMNAQGSALNTSTEVTEIAAMEGVFVKATTANQKVTFTTQTRGREHATIAQANIMVVDDDCTVLDNAILRFDGGQTLEKFSFREGSTKIYLPQDGTNYAIACTESTGEIPVNFEAEKNGTYTITVNPEGVEMVYLHLIDNMTGVDIDLLHTQNFIADCDPQSPTSKYTFTAKTTDYPSRFKLVFAVKDGPSTGSGSFAFISNGNIIVNGEGTLQIVDVTGRIVRCTDVARNVSTNGMTPGVYVLRLINGNDVKTQKIVVK